MSEKMKRGIVLFLAMLFILLAIAGAVLPMLGVF